MRAKSLKHLEDRVGGGGPVERGFALVVGRHELLDLGNQLLDAGEPASPDCPLGDDLEPALHLVEQGGFGGGVVDLEAGPLGQPGTNLGVLVGAVIVHDQVDVPIHRDGLLDLAEEKARERALHWVLPSAGLVWSARLITSATVSSP